MAFFSFGGRVKPKKFDYIPMHYDAAKEELEARLGKYGETEISDSELAKARIKSGIRMKARGNQEVLRTGKKEANIRLFIIMLMLFCASIYFLQSEAFNVFIESILN
ncbi:MAG: hypothetical protein P1U56_06075 [Saprospiraceae bacterium]|nr:hypothetical protein [Saprospiraceae bacterium]